MSLLRWLLRKVDLAFQIEHAVFENADARDQCTLIPFQLGDTLPVGFGEGIECLQDLRLDVAHGFHDAAFRKLQVLLSCLLVAVFHGMGSFCILRQKGPGFVRSDSTRVSAYKAPAAKTAGATSCSLPDLL